eukprot:6184378-Pleurochrysis_carterae.AAC.2
MDLGNIQACLLLLSVRQQLLHSVHTTLTAIPTKVATKLDSRPHSCAYSHELASWSQVLSRIDDLRHVIDKMDERRR